VTAPEPIVAASRVWKTFRLPQDRPLTFKQRVLHPRRSRRATNLHALKDVSFEIADGEFFGIIGRNGSGKSTLLKCLAGIYRPNRGSLAVGGRVSPFIELGVGFNPELTARDNVVVNAALLGIPAAEANARFPEIVRFAELEQFVELKLKNYSSGMQVRLGFATAIQADADVYLVDEVLAVGDARFQQKCFDTFREFKREGRTVIYVTHDLDTVERFCDRAMWLENGEVEAIGAPQDVIRTYRQRDIEIAQTTQHARRQTAARWGDGAAEIVEAWIEDADGRRQEVVSQGATFAFKARARFVAPMVDPILGVTFNGEDRNAVFITNTNFDHLVTGAFEPGDEVVYSIAFPMHFADGTYTASPAIAHDHSRMADWREGLVTFRVQGERHTGSVVDLPHETDVSAETGAQRSSAIRGSARR
jgi:ABC-type polysaccharide/polyol phosphate transport system ATPase subunit